jgi:ABC-2 type transport system ATP-binding protein
VLEVQNLTKRYGKSLAVDGVTFTALPGKVSVLLGPNGAGKSTVIKSIAGLLRYEGGIGICGYQARTVEAKKRFGYVPEIPALFDALTVREHMEYIKRAYGVDVSDEEIDALLQRFELYDKQDKMGNELSKGMMQKVSICAALLIRPQVILLDEPMVGLDPAAIKELKEVILELKEENVTVLVSTHMLEMVKELWDMIFIMDHGKIIGSFNREEHKDTDIEELFFAVTGKTDENADQHLDGNGGEET